MIASDKREWKKSILAAKNSKDSHPLSQAENVMMSFSGSPNFHPSLINNACRLRHLSELSSSSDVDPTDANIVLVGAVSRRTLFNIIKLLNLSYPDYDFTQTQSGCFTIVSYQVIF